MIRKVFLISAMTLAAMGAAAQDAVATPYSVRAAMEIVVPSGGHDSYRTGAGAAVGAFYRLPLARNVYFEPGLEGFYHSMTAKQDMLIGDYYYQGSAQLAGLRIPLMFGYNFSTSPLLDISLSTGPWMNINLYGRQSILPNFDAPDRVPNQKINLFKHGFRRVDALWGIRLKFTFAKNYSVGIVTAVAFTPLASFGMRDKKVKIYGHTIGISLGYNF